MSHITVKLLGQTLVKQQTQILEFCFGCIIYSFKSLLILYLTQRLSLPLPRAYSILAIYFGSGILEYAALGLINKLYNYSFAIMEGLLLNLVGIILLYFASNHVIFAVYLALSLIAIGNVLLVAGVFILSAKVAKKAKEQMVFTKNFAFLNFGAVVGLLISGAIYSTLGMDAALGLLFFLFLFALIEFIIFTLHDNKKINITKKNIVKNMLAQLAVLTLSLLLSSFYYLNINIKWSPMVWWIAVFVLIVSQLKKIQAKLLMVNLLCILFFISFSQLFGSIILFTNHYVDDTIYGIKAPLQSLLTLEPIFVIVFFIMAKKWTIIRNCLQNYSCLKKLSIALLTLSVAFSILGILGYFNANTKINLLWLALFYFFISLSEFIFIPTYYDYLAQTVPYNLLGIGFSYFLIIKIMGNYLSMTFTKIVFQSSLTSVESKKYIFLFAILAFISVIPALTYFSIKIRSYLKAGLPYPLRIVLDSLKKVH